MTATSRSGRVPVNDRQRPGVSRAALTAALVRRVEQRCGDAIPAVEVRAIVCACLDELAGSPVTALPELAERLAVQRVLLHRESDRGGGETER